MDDPAPPAILVVEDERGLADLYAEWLADDYPVETVYTGKDAMEMIADRFDVVLLDRRMPGVSGDQVLDRIRNKGLDCRVVIVSAVEPDFDVIELDFDDYLVKPISREDLIDAVQRMQGRREYEPDLQRYFALVSKKATLEEEKRMDELEENAEYQTLLEEIVDLWDRVDTTLTALDRDDLRAVLRDPASADRSR